MPMRLENGFRSFSCSPAVVVAGLVPSTAGKQIRVAGTSPATTNEAFNPTAIRSSFVRCAALNRAGCLSVLQLAFQGRALAHLGARLVLFKVGLVVDRGLQDYLIRNRL